MRVLFATNRLYPPDRHGGAQNSAHALLSRVAARGNFCEAVAAHRPGIGLTARRALVAASKRRWFGPPDHANGYATRRVAPWHIAPLVANRADAFRPDVLVTDHPDVLRTIEDECPGLRVPAVLRVADVSFRDHEDGWPRYPRLRAFANSNFIQQCLQAEMHIDAPVLYPIIEPERYRTDRDDDASWITFVNPIEGKGLSVVLGIAERLPHHTFVLVSGWPRPGEEVARVTDRLARLPNAQLHPWTPDIREVFRRTRLLLFPAQWDEGFGRVVLEAHASGIPAVTSDRGGLPEAVRDGGRVLAAHAPIDEWAATVDRIMSDPRLYNDLSARATANLRRPEFNAESIADRFVALLREQVSEG